MELIFGKTLMLKKFTILDSTLTVSVADSKAEATEDNYASLGVTFLELTNQIQNVLQVTTIKG